MSKATIAILGLNGFLGKPIIDALDSGIFDDKIAYPVKAITRKEPAFRHDKIEYIIADITSDPIDSIVEKLGHVDTVIELLAANSTIFNKVEELLTKLKPKLFIPSQFGTDIPKVDQYAPGFLAIKTVHSEAVRDLGIKVVDVLTALFATPGAFLYEWISHLGANVQDKTINVIGDFNQKFHINKVEDIANTILSIATYPNPESLPDSIRIGSDVITPKIAIDTYSKNHNNIEFKIISETSADVAKKQLKEELAKGFDHDRFLWYLQVILAQGLDNGLYFGELDNELVNPGESLWKWSKW